MPSLPSAPPLWCLSFAPSPRLRRSAGSSVPSAGGCAGSAGALPSPGMPAPPSVCYPKTLQTGDHCDFQGLGPRELRPQNSPENFKVKMKTSELFCFSLGLWERNGFAPVTAVQSNSLHNQNWLNSLDNQNWLNSLHNQNWLNSLLNCSQFYWVWVLICAHLCSSVIICALLQSAWQSFLITSAFSRRDSDNQRPVQLKTCAAQLEDPARGPWIPWRHSAARALAMLIPSGDFKA